MYSIREVCERLDSAMFDEIWQDSIACGTVNKEVTFRTNRLQDTIACFTFTLVKRGHLRLETNRQVVDLFPNELYLHMPGLDIKILSVSDDYKAEALLVDEQMMYRSPVFRNIISLSSLPLAMGVTPKISLSAERARVLEGLMQQMHRHILHPGRLGDELVRTYCSAFVYELTLVHDNAAGHGRVSRRQEELFAQFYALMRQHFIAHRDLAFYADKLHITTTYLSRVVQQLTHHTVGYFTDRALLNESVWLLHSTELSVTQIADRLNFSSPAAFCKFFNRMTGSTPKAYRQQKVLSTGGLRVPRLAHP